MTRINPRREAIVFGAGGLLARELVPQLLRGGWGVAALVRSDCDVRSRASVEAQVARIRPDVIINCAAYTHVDKAEREEELAFTVNAEGAGHVAVAAASRGARLLHISTDYVFDGQSRRPYREDERPSPLGAYGRTKLAGEQRVTEAGGDALIVRTGELYGTGGRNFFDTILGRVQAAAPVRVVDDQIVSPTWTRELAAQLVALAESDAPGGVYHATSSGEVSWYGAARAAVGALGLREDLVVPISTAAFGSATPRPAYSVLAPEALARRGLYRMRPWHESLAAWIAERHG
jgi:dTDP-4-dehydrorhamnose reductase